MIIEKIRHDINKLADAINRLRLEGVDLTPIYNQLAQKLNISDFNKLQLDYDYIIYTDGTNVYALNTKTKAIERTGTPEDVFNYVSNILNQNGGSVFVKGWKPDGTRAVYTFNTQGIYINTHKKVEWISDGAILQHNITVTNAQGQVGDLVTGNNLFYLDVNNYTDCQITIKGFVIQDLRTSAPDYNPSFPDPEGQNRIIDVRWGITDFSTQPYNGRRIVIENNIIMPSLGTVLWTNPGAQFIEFRNNLIVGRIRDCVHFDYAGHSTVEGNVIFNTYQLKAGDDPRVSGIFYWDADGNLPMTSGSAMVIRNNVLYNCSITLHNPSGAIVEGNYIIWLPNSVNTSNPPSAGYSMLYINRTVNVAQNYSNTKIKNNYLLRLTTWDGLRGIHINARLNDLEIEGNTIILYGDGYVFTVDDYVSSINDENGEVVSRVRIANNRIFAIYGINIYSSASNATIRNLEIINNIINSANASIYSSGIKIDGAQKLENVIIKNNVLRSRWSGTITATFIYIASQVKNLIIEGNILDKGATTLNPTSPLITISNPVTGTVKVINNINYNPRPPSSITVGASPFVYRNTDFYPEDIIISGRAVSSIEWSRDGSTYYNLGITAGKVRLEPGEYLRITYTTAPTMIKVPL